MNAIASLRSARRVLALSSFLFLASLPGRTQVVMNVEALSGKHAPGTPAAFTWNTLGGAAIADDGEITFRAFLDDHVGGLAEIGIWRGSGSNYTLVVRSDDTAPGAGAGAKFDEPFVPVIRAASGAAPKPLAFYATVNTGTSSVGSIWSVVNGTVTKIALVGESAPGGQMYQSFFQKLLVSADDGSTVFVGRAGGAVSIWSSSGGSVALAAKDGQNVPGLAQGQFSLSSSSLIAVSGGASPLIAFQANIANPPVNGHGIQQGNGLFLEDFGQPASAYRLQGDDAAPFIPGAYFTSFLDYDVNSAGRVAFVANLASQTPGVVNSTDDQGIFLGDLLLARRGRPSLVNGFNYDGFDGVLINDAGKVAFMAYLTDAANNSRSVVCLSDNFTNQYVIAATGDHAPGTPAGVTFTSFANVSTGRLQLNNGGQVLFLGFDSAGQRGLWCTDGNGKLQLIVRTGDQIPVAAGDTRTITAINYLNGTAIGSGGRDGRARALNDSGQVAYGVTFSDGSSGIVRSSLGSSGNLLPSLSIFRSGSGSNSGPNISIRWPSALSNEVLQITTNITAPLWVTVPTNGLLDDGTWKTYVKTNAPGSNGFFKLQRP